MSRFLRQLEKLTLIEVRSLIPIFGGLLILLIVFSLGVGKYNRGQKRKELLRQKDIQEQELQEQRRDAEARKQHEEEERRKRERYDYLKLVGVRSVPFSSAVTALERSVGVWLALETEPDGAEIFLDWESRGHTPLYLNSVAIDGYLVIAKDGYDAAFRNISYTESNELRITLSPEGELPKNRLLLLSIASAPQELFDVLRNRFIDRGFTVLGLENSLDFQRVEQAAGGLSHSAVRAWTGSKFNTSLIVKASVSHQIRDLGRQVAVLTDAVRSVVNIDLDVYDVRSGGQLAHIAGHGSAFELGEARSFTVALTQASEDSVQKMHTQFMGR